MLKDSDIERLEINLNAAYDKCAEIETERTELLYSVALLTGSKVLRSGEALRAYLLEYDASHPLEDAAYRQAAKAKLKAVCEPAEALDHKLWLAVADRDRKERAYLDAMEQWRWEAIHDEPPIQAHAWQSTQAAL